MSERPAPGAPAGQLLRELWRKIDEFFHRVDARYPGELACKAGCDDCCRRELSVTGVEAEAILEALAEMDDEVRASLAARAGAPADGACAALEPDGRCAIYAARPLVCRSHGVPLRFEDRVQGKRSLPVVDACFKNFVGRDLSTVDADCVLDQATLSTMLAAIDAARADACGKPRGRRVPLRTLLGSD